MKVLVFGGRNYENKRFLYGKMDRVHARFGITHVIHGGASGADSLADRWAEDRGIQPVMCRALWSFYDKPGRKNPAGPIRNEAMLALAPDYYVSFPGGAGTADMLTRLRHYGIKGEIANDNELATSGTG